MRYPAIEDFWGTGPGVWMDQRGGVTGARSLASAIRCVSRFSPATLPWFWHTTGTPATGLPRRTPHPETTPQSHRRHIAE